MEIEGPNLHSLVAHLAWEGFCWLMAHKVWGGSNDLYGLGGGFGGFGGLETSNTLKKKLVPMGMELVPWESPTICSTTKPRLWLSLQRLLSS
ncbi:hypothetical protein VNO77_03669 [Canavalia gladiata]|uniref:Uncharacterized protein n=1 Tax=Canavalia gladiata TaxID=3824 RepID=A0AAN9N0T0_CANGL